MSYQLRRSQTLGDNLRRICREQIEEAIAVAKGEKESRDTPVHETRKHLKKTRAALRLVRKEIGRGLFREQDHCLRDVARLISDVRDAEVRLQTVQQFDRISRRRRQEGYGNLEQTLQSELENFTASIRGMEDASGSDVAIYARKYRPLGAWPFQFHTTLPRRPGAL